MSTYTDQKAQAICQQLRCGLSRRNACAVEDVPRPTFYYWMKQGKEGKEPYATFLEMVEKAEAEFLGAAEVRLRHFAAENWKANAWLLERRDPEQYGQKREHNHGGTVGHAYMGQARPLTQAEADGLRARVLGLPREEVRELREQEELSRKKFGLGG